MFKQVFIKHIQLLKSKKLFTKGTYKKQDQAGFFADLVNFLKHISWKSPKAIAFSIAALIVLCGGIFYLSATVSAVSISVNGEKIGYTQNIKEAQQIVQTALSLKGGSSGQVVQTDDEIVYKKVRVGKNEFQIHQATVALLMTTITPFVESYGIKINDKIVAYLASEDHVNSVLDKFKEYFTKPSANNIVSSAEFEEDVSKVFAKVSPKEIKTVDEALELLIKGDIQERNYTIQQDDSLWLIARKNNMLVDEILAANPGYTEDSILQPGDVIKLTKIEPYLTVLSKGTRTVEEVIPFDVETIISTKVASGKTVVQQAGKDGKKAVTYSYTAKNGKVIEKKVLQEEVISKPVKQVVAKGQVQRPVYVASRGSGSIHGLKWPLSGRITSYYGYRSGGFHTGIDIDGSTGQPFVAAAGGKVAFSGWSGGYGYCIIINHGNGVATRYAHASKLYVSVGNTVKQGQTIGLVGSTGRSTGSHLHFEVIINGSTVNPLNYL
jgi:murein DD-endopeptidase MepM/ murein hydrolase activator NlpD/predicted transposase YbfD/YdcC